MPIYTQKIGDLVFMNDCYHRTYGGFGLRINLEARFAKYDFENIISKNKNNYDRLNSYLPINQVLSLDENNLKFLNTRNGLNSKKAYPVDFELKFK